jgi:hypothetical protein
VAEICDGLDNDCNGAIDDLTGTCSTGLPGACGEGLASCSGGAPQCSLSLLPGQLPEYCGDGQDNDCDGQSDEVGCTIVSPGEVCWLPIEAGTGGHFSGDLSTHTHDVMAGCWGNAPDLVYALRVPQGQSWQVNGVVQGAGAALIGSDCAHPNTFNCFGGTAAGDMPDAGAPPPPPDAGIPPADGGIAPPDGGFDGGIAPPDGGFDGGVAPPDGGFDGGVAPTDSGSATSASTLPSATSFSTTLSEGTHLIVVQGTGHFDLNLSIYDPATGHCITPDQDGDGFDPCQGDCNDSNAAIHPGAAEACDGIDNDCNGVIDDAHAACDTGQPGACEQGRTACNGTVTECMPLHAPLPEICADGVDNDCNGVTDEATCSARESCADAEDVGPGGSFYGNLDAAGNDVPNACSMAGGGDHVYRIQIPVNGGSFGVVGASGNVEVSLFQDVCGGSLYDCSNATRSFGWSGGTFYVVVKGSGAYALSLAIQNGGTQCSVPDLDGDGHTICDRDCNEGNASVYPGAAEICDGLDNDCDGVIDDVSGTCSTGLPGVCAQGTPSCNGTSLVCTPQHNPGATPDYCGDGLDNDCNGSIDEAGCTQVQPGEVCSLPIDMGPGGTFSGDLSSYAADVTAIDCGQGNDVVYKLDVPADGRHMASVRVGGNASLAMFTGACGQGYGSCFLSSSAVSLGSTGGTYYFVVKGSGPYTVSAAVRDLMNNSCSVGDHDGDGITLCDNDCNDLNPDIHPGAEELCDGIDNDCNGPIDDIKGSRPTGLPGACSQGTPYCSGGSAQCYVNLSPGQQADYCGDGIDNNCDGSTDEPSCLTVPPGEVCSLSIDLAQGGIFAGDLSSATDDVSGTCFGSGLPDRVYLLNVPQGQGYDVRVQLAGAEATLFGAQCDNGAFIQACFQPSSTQYRTLSPGAYHLVVEGSSSYMLSVGLRDSMTGVCLTPDADGDGMTQCDNDCNDADPSVHPGASELCGDGKDNDCDGVIDNGCP